MKSCTNLKIKEPFGCVYFSRLPFLDEDDEDGEDEDDEAD